MWGNGKIFISHSHADNAACEPLLAALDAWGLDYWFDRQQLDAGSQLTDRLQRAIGERDIFLRICTAATRASYWMTLEFNAFRGLQLSEQQRQSKGTNRRQSVNLILDAGYTSAANAADLLNERADAVVDATASPPAVWLAQLEAALGIASSKGARKGVSRRAVVGLGAAAVVTVAAGGTAVVVREQSTQPVVAVVPKPMKVPFAVPNPQTADPRIAWDFRCGSDLPAAIALGASTLFVNSDDGMFSLAETDGSIVWSNGSVNGNSAQAPVVVGETVYAIGGLGKLAALGASDGVLRWTFDTDVSFGLSGFAVAADSIFLPAGDGSMLAFSTADGSKRWQSAVLAKSNLNTPTPVVSGGLVLTGATDGYLYALSAATGAMVWRYQTQGDVSATAATDGSTVYFGSNDASIYAVDLASGTLKWSKALGNQVTVAPTVRNGVVYVSVETTLYALSAATGGRTWAVPVGDVDSSGNSTSFDYVSAAAGVAGDLIFVLSGAYLYAFSAHAAATYAPTSGKPAYAWKFAAAKSFDNTVAPVAGAGTVFFTSDNGWVYALKTA